MERLKEKYIKVALPKMMEKFGYTSQMAAPKIRKVIINTGYGRIISGKGTDEQRKYADFIVEELTAITGQRAVKTLAKKSIASFKVREGMPVGAMVTLRGNRMYDFLDKLIHVVLPRTRDFKGIDPNSVDQSGNLTVAIKEYIAFPEVLPERAKNIFGLEITVVSDAKNKEKGLELFKLLGFPIRQ